MNDFATRLVRDAVRESETALQPLVRACRSQEHLYRFFLQTGWHLDAALGVDLAALRIHVEEARRAIQSIQGAAFQGDAPAVALALRNAFKDVMERAEPLYAILTAAAPRPVPDHVLQAFVEDLTLHLATLYLATRSPFAFKLGQMAGLIRIERATPLYSSPPERKMLRYPVERLLVRPRNVVMGALNPALAMLSELNDPDTLLERLQDRLEAEATRVLAAAGGSLEGLELRLTPTGIHVLGGRLPRPPASGGPVRLPLNDAGSCALEIAPEGYGLTWAAGTSPDGAIMLLETAGVRFFIPSRPAVDGSQTGLTLSESAGRIALDFVGALAVELPMDVVTGQQGDAVRASARVRMGFRQGEAPALSLDEMRLQGRFRIGGPDGLLIDEAELVLSQMAWPLPQPTPARPLPCDLSVKGVLAFAGDDFRLEVDAEYRQGTWKLRSTGHARFPNGLELRPVGTRPVLELEVSPAGPYRLGAAGEIRLPQGSATAGLSATGHLIIGVQNDTLEIRDLDVRGEATNWSLGSGITIDRLSVSLGHQPGRFTATMAATIPFGDGFVLEILDELPAGLPPGGPIPGLAAADAGGVLTVTIAGGMRLTFPPKVLTSAEGSLPVKVMASGILTLSSDTNRPPALSSLAFALDAPRLRLGGDDGLIIENASFMATNVDRLFGQGGTPFATIVMGGRVVCPIEMSSGRLTFDLKGAQFTFANGLNSPPQFGFAEDGKLGVENATPAGFPLQVSKASVGLKTHGPLPDVLKPNNLVVTMSVALAADFSDIAAAVAGVEGITAEIRDGLPRVKFEGLKFGVDDLQIPPMRFTGVLGVHNLLDPMNLQLEGALGGTVQGATVKALVAMKLDQGKPSPLGVCLDVNLGPSGIQIAYGFTVQGAAGGISFANTNADPCSFTTYSEEARRIREASAAAEVATGATSGARMPAARPAPFSGCHCECPPPSMNILCQPHPNQDLHPGRAILKFSAVEEHMWAELPVPRSNGGTITVGRLLDEADQQIRGELARRIGGFDAGARARAVAQQVTSALKSSVAGMIPPLDPSRIQPQPPPEARAAFDKLAGAYMRPAEHWAQEMSGDLAEEVGKQLQLLATGASAPTLRKLVADQLYRGVNCPDRTMQVTGSFSYVGVSAFAYVSGGVNVSTAGSVGVLGTLTVFGVPFGVLRAFVTATDATGNLQPGMCGDLAFEMGPIRFGEMCVEYKIPGAVTNFANALGRFGGQLSRPVIDKVLQRMERADLRFSQRPGFDLASDVGQSLKLLTAAESAQFISCVLSESRLAAPDARTVALFAAELARDLWAGFNPEITLCGEVAPEIFGIKIASLAQAKAVITKDRFIAEFSFSPMYILGRISPIADMFSGMDKAALAISLAFPRIEQLATDGLVAHLSGQQSLAQVIEAGIARTMRDTTMTFSYQFFPLGMRLVDGQGRIVLPHLTPHPASRDSKWSNPDNAPATGPTARPSRRRALFAALDANRLRDVTWSGKLADVMTLPADQTLELQRDYFPHGGVLGAGKLMVPRLLWDFPPVELLTETLQSTDWGVRLRNLITLMKDWVLATREAGTLAMYLPAPTPPAALINKPDVSMRALTDAVKQLNPAVNPDGTFGQGPGMAMDLAFFKGVAKGQILGLQLGEGDITFTPPSAARAFGAMEVSVRLAQDARLAKWIDPATVTLSLTQGADTAALSAANRQTLDERFTALRERLESQRTSPATAASVKAVVESVLRALGGHLPKASLVANVAMRSPDELAPWLGAASVNAELRAYSPFYDPAATGDTALDRVKRNGGWWFRSQLRFRFGDLLRCTTWVEGSFELGSDLARPARLIGEAALNAVDSFTFLGAPVQMAAAKLALDTGAAVGQSVLALKGDCGPLVFGPVRIEPTAGPRLAIELHARRAASGAAVALRLTPARLRLPGVDATTPIDILAEPGRDRIELGSAGGTVRMAAPNGLKITGPTGAVILELGGMIGGMLSMSSTQLPSLTLNLPQGFRAVAFPQDAALKTTLVLPAATTLLIKGDGTFALQTAMPALPVAGGLFTLHGASDIAAPIPVIITEREIRLNGAAKFSVQVPGAARASGNLDTMAMSSNGAFDVRGTGLALRLGGIVEASAAGFILSRNAQGFELTVANAELRFDALPGFTHRWSLKLRPNTFEAELSPGATRTCAFGRRLSVGAASWRARGSFTELSLAATAPQVTVLGTAVSVGTAAALTLTTPATGPKVRASIDMSGELQMIPDVAHILPSRAQLDWSPTGGSLSLITGVRALKKHDGSQGWILDKQATLNLSQDNFNHAFTGSLQLFSKPGLSVTAELKLGFDGGWFVAADTIAVSCLGVSLPAKSARIGTDGRMSLSWTQSATPRVGPFSLQLSGFRLDVDTRGASVQMQLPQARLSAGGGNWPSGSRPLNGLSLGWTSGTPAPRDYSVEFGGSDSGTRSLGVIDYKLSGPKVAVKISVSGGALTAGTATLSGTISAWTQAKRPDNNEPWASAMLGISRTINSDGQVALSLPGLDAGTDPLRGLRDACHRTADLIPIPPIARERFTGIEVPGSRQVHDNAVAVVNAAKDACNTKFPGAPPAISPGTTGLIGLKDLFSFTG